MYDIIYGRRASISSRIFHIADKLKIEIECPMDQVTRLDLGIKDGSLANEIDKIHGIDFVMHHGRKDVKISKFQVSLAPARPANQETRRTVESLEHRLLEVERNERTRSIDLRGTIDAIYD